MQTVQIDKPLTLRLGGVDGPVLVLQPETAAAATARASVPVGQTRVLANYVDRYFSAKGTDGPVGQRTQLIRKAFENVQRKQKRRFGWIVAVMTVLAVAAGGYAYYGHRQMRQQQAIAEDLFYTMKSLDVDIANVERLVEALVMPRARIRSRSYLERRRQMENNYDRFLSGLKLYGGNLTEAGAPDPARDPHVRRVRAGRAAGIRRRSRPLHRAVAVDRTIRSCHQARRGKGLHQRRSPRSSSAHNLPPQFFYLALQESDFDPFIERSADALRASRKACGSSFRRPASAMGCDRAAGRIRAAGRRRRSAQLGESHRAAARYIKDIYATDAQASGLLVMASYNWGEASNRSSCCEACPPIRRSATSGSCSNATAKTCRTRRTTMSSQLSRQR